MDLSSEPTKVTPCKADCKALSSEIGRVIHIYLVTPNPRRRCAYSIIYLNLLSIIEFADVALSSLVIMDNAGRLDEFDVDIELREPSKMATADADSMRI